jgi:asparagine synthase (glutamine-hydrolysing)
MRERGPDSQNVFVSQYGCVGAVRLAILDIDNGHQPMVSPDNKHVLALNGEIYNYKQLQTELSKKGWVFKTNCDTEVVLALMAIEGIEAIDKLQGFFAFVWLNLEQKCIVGVRDHFGIKPLYLHDAGKKSSFSSKISVLLDFFDSKPKPNYQALHNFYTFRCYPDNQTPFQNIFECEPGSITIINNDGKITKKRWWTLENAWSSIEQIPANQRSFDETSDELSTLIDNIILSETQSDEEISGFLSSGIDSALVMNSAFRQQKLSKVFGFSMRGIDKRDEYPDALTTAKKIGVKISMSEFEGNEKERVLQMLKSFDVPTVCSFQIQQISRSASKEFKVVLTGSGGDELFGGYDRHWKADPKTNLLQKKFFGKPILSKAGEDLFYERQLFKPTQRNELYSKYFKSQIDEGAAINYVIDIFRNCPRQDAISQTMFYDQKIWLPKMGNTNLDRMSMSQSIEARVPLMRRELLDFSLSLPHEFMFKYNQGKLLLKDLVTKKIGTDIAMRKKFGFTMPLITWLHKIVLENAIPILKSEQFLSRDLFNPRYIDWLLNFSNRRITGHDTLLLWTLYISELWFREFID